MSIIETITDLPQRLRAANNAQRGSFGEFLFAEVAPASATAIHRNRIDFVCGDLPIDVKTTTKNVGKPLRPLTPYHGPRVKGTSYALVEFGTEGARVSLEADVLQMITWPESRRRVAEVGKGETASIGGRRGTATGACGCLL